jgi:uncharacterized membrane protein YfhO
MEEKKLYKFANDLLKEVKYGVGILVLSSCVYLSNGTNQLPGLDKNNEFMNGLEKKVTEVFNYKGYGGGINYDRSNDSTNETTMTPVLTNNHDKFGPYKISYEDNDKSDESIYSSIKTRTESF